MASDSGIVPLDHLPKLPEQRDIGIGCIGSGFIMSDCHLPAYRQHGLSPVAIASRHIENARAAAQAHQIPSVYESSDELLADPRVEVVDVAVPPDVQIDIVRRIVRHDHIRGVLLQKPIGVDYAQAAEVIRLLRDAGKTVAVNQNMRFDHSVASCKQLLAAGELGHPILATIDMRAIPHWMPWQQRQGWVTLRIMSIHHIDTFRFWLGDPDRIFASVRPDPRTAEKFDHTDGICLYILEYDDGPRATAWDDVWTGPALEGAAKDLGIRWRVEGTDGTATGTVGWPHYPNRAPSTIDYTTVRTGNTWISPRWDEVWFPDAFVGPMAELLCAMEEDREPSINGEDNLRTMALVDAAYIAAAEHRAVSPAEAMEKAAAV